MELTEKLSSTKFYPLADFHPLRMTKGKQLRARWNGEKRPPKKGEWYLSGAIIEAYKAPSDLSTPYHIAELVLIEVVK